MAANRRRIWRGRSLAGALAVLLTAGCEAARMPLEVNPAGAPAPLTYTSLVGEPARLAWIASLSKELQALNYQISRGPAEPAIVERAAWLRDQIEAVRSRAISTDEDAHIIDFGTQVDLSTAVAGAVRAFTETSRATKIKHTIWIRETSGGSTYEHPALTHDSGWLNQRSLLTSIDVDRCTKPMTVVARTHHEAGSFTVDKSQALSRADGSCNPPASPCPSDKDGPISYSCTGGGSSGGTTTVTCYTVTIEHYWYYPETDTYEYRYSDTSTWCESST